jgi:hypothetical protein
MVGKRYSNLGKSATSVVLEGIKVKDLSRTKIKLIGKSKKTDRNDSFHLANLLRMDYQPLRYLRKGTKR